MIDRQGFTFFPNFRQSKRKTIMLKRLLFTLCIMLGATTFLLRLTTLQASAGENCVTFIFNLYCPWATQP